MAQLNSLLVTGDSRFLNKIHGTIENSDAVGGHETPASGDASATQVVLGNDSRLKDTTYTFTGGVNKITVTPSDGAATDVNITVDDDTKLPLAGGILTGDVFITRGTDTQRKFGFLNNSDKFGGLKLNNSGNNIDFGWDYDTVAGSGAYFRGVGFSSSYGEFGFFARHSTGTTQLVGRSNGLLTWGGRRVVTSTNGEAVGGGTHPIYVNSAGQVVACDNAMAAIYIESVDPPYHSGDLWFSGDNTYYCIASRETGDLDMNDWVVVSSDLNSDEVSAIVKQEISVALGNNGGNIVWHDGDGDGVPDEILVLRNENDLTQPATIDNATIVWRFDNNGLSYSLNGYRGTYYPIINQNGEGVADFLQTGTLDASKVTIANFNSAMITAGLLKRGGLNNQYGEIELYNDAGVLIGLVNNTGFTWYGSGQVGQRPCITINDTEGFVGYDTDDPIIANRNKIFEVTLDEFRMKKCVAQQEMQIGGKARFVPITISSNGTVVNDGIALVAMT